MAMHLVYRALQGDMIPDQVRHVVGGGGAVDPGSSSFSFLDPDLDSGEKN